MLESIGAVTDDANVAFHVAERWDDSIYAGAVLVAIAVNVEHEGRAENRADCRYSYVAWLYVKWEPLGFGRE